MISEKKFHHKKISQDLALVNETEIKFLIFLPVERTIEIGLHKLINL